MSCEEATFWIIIAVLLVFVGMVMILEGVKLRLAIVWRLLLVVIGIFLIGAGLYWQLILVGLTIP